MIANRLAGSVSVSLAEKDRIGRGAFADVFSPDGARAYKLFRRISDPELFHSQPLVFEAETRAYEIASADKELAKYIPQYFGTVTVSSVLTREREDIISQYWPELCYVMERLPADKLERKFGSFYQTKSWPRMELIDRLFENAGIRHLGDASVLRWRRKYPKLIDFAVSDAAADNWRPSPTAT